MPVSPVYVPLMRRTRSPTCSHAVRQTKVQMHDKRLCQAPSHVADTSLA